MNLCAHEEKTRLSQKFKSEFDYQIIQRGINYYKNKNIEAVYKNGDTYYSRVLSDDGFTKYNVKITKTEDDFDMECDCPYCFYCKHEYATLLAIDNKDIKEIDLLPEPEYITYDLHDIIKKIPADELKQYILDKVLVTRQVFDNMNIFNKRFNQYIPVKKEEYYYNRLYNLLLMDIDVSDLISNYMESIKQYIDYKNYRQAFIIIYAIINAYYKVNPNSSLEQVQDGIIVKLGMYSRIVYRRIDNNEKEKINAWISELKEKEFFNDVYLEDMLLTINYIR